MEYKCSQVTVYRMPVTKSSFFYHGKCICLNHKQEQMQFHLNNMSVSLISEIGANFIFWSHELFLTIWMILITEEVTATKIPSCNVWLIMAVISLTIGCSGIIAIAVLRSQDLVTVYEVNVLYIDGVIVFEYGVVLDAGSSHTALFVYKWNGEKFNNTALANQIGYQKAEPGISSYETNPHGLEKDLSTLLDYAKTVVPTGSHSSTSVYLGATAGMRLLRDTIKNYPFEFSKDTVDARILSGGEEGMYSWVTSNYVAGKFDNTVGALDLGGASTQITFYPGSSINIPVKYKGDLVLYGMNYTVYTNSYLCYGINEITRKYKALLVKNQSFNETIIDPCGPKDRQWLEDYTDIFEAPCTKQSYQPDIIVKNIVRQLFNFSTCSYDHCGFNGEYQPKLNGQYYVSFFQFCLPDDVEKMKANVTSVLPWYCFRGRYILTLMTEGYKFNNDTWKNVNFIDKINGTEIGWSLGFMLDSSNSEPVKPPVSPITLVTFILLVVLFVVFLLIAVGFFCHAHKYRDLKRKGMYEKLK
ncbi:hypothetical protein KUTeg_005401 [Tegillarca granosa]|uniref:Ectonucleoside triphosphate diphosphohydrolase 1 n=1 Tax=Tegillarca granosa TaxID=220873 RepID=A0ABQ9FJL3_TEGGR|nr:hypothetical protein KUTeg_005401 [Tegillarca granosa]